VLLGVWEGCWGVWVVYRGWLLGLGDLPVWRRWRRGSCEEKEGMTSQEDESCGTTERML
jgi:hypothetical protein